MVPVPSDHGVPREPPRQQRLLPGSLSCCCQIALIYVQLSVFFHLESLGWFLVRKVGFSGKHVLSCGMHRAQPSAPAVFLGVLSPGLVASPQTGGLGDALGRSAWKQRELCRCQSGLPQLLGPRHSCSHLGVSVQSCASSLHLANGKVFEGWVCS